MAQCLTQAQCLACAFLSPCGGEEMTSPKKKRMPVHCRIYLALPFLMLRCAHQRDWPYFSLVAIYYVACCCPCCRQRNKKKRKKNEDWIRVTIATPPQCRQWSNQMLFPGGALLVDRDGLKTEVMVSGRFLRSVVFLCKGNSTFHDCTATLRLVHNADSGKASVCTNFGVFIRFCRFSPFAEEGFTCLDHSMLSKKKSPFCWSLSRYGLWQVPRNREQWFWWNISPEEVREIGDPLRETLAGIPAGNFRCSSMR